MGNSFTPPSAIADLREHLQGAVEILADALGRVGIGADHDGDTARLHEAEEGEAGFRAREAAVLEELCGRRRHVIATGGGVVLRPENRDRLRAAGLVVWLTADAPTLWERLRQDATTAERRPALTVGGLAAVEEFLRARRPLYEAVAHLAVDTARRSPPEVAEAILALLPRQPGPAP